jgi:hypothetical protein
MKYIIELELTTGDTRYAQNRHNEDRGREKVRRHRAMSSLAEAQRFSSKGQGRDACAVSWLVGQGGSIVRRTRTGFLFLPETLEHPRTRQPLRRWWRRASWVEVWEPYEPFLWYGIMIGEGHGRWVRTVWADL